MKWLMGIAILTAVAAVAVQLPLVGIAMFGTGLGYIMADLGEQVLQQRQLQRWRRETLSRVDK